MAEPALFHLSDYSESDSASIQQMELTCAQPLSSDFPFHIVKYARIYQSPYHFRPQMYSDHLTILAKWSDSGKVVGVISGAVKTAYYDNAPVRTGYVFDLRVHDEYKRQGVGTALVKAMEKRLAVKGAELIYAVIYVKNKPAEMMFRGDLGYKIATRKTVHVEETVAKNKSPMPLIQVDRKEAEAHLLGFYKDKDLSLVSYSELFASPEYLGTYCVQDEAGNKAEASLWHTTRHTSRSVVQVLYPVSTLQNSQYFLPFMILSLLGLGLGVMMTLGVYQWIGPQVLKLLWGAAMLLVGLLVGEFWWVFVKNWRLAISHPNGEQKISLFGLHYTGLPESKESLYDSLISGLLIVCHPSSDLLTWTVDSSDPDRHCFSSDMHELLYLHKKPQADYWNAWTRNLFYDPRDLV